MEEDDFDHIERDEIPIDSFWLWDEVSLAKAFVKKGANNAGLTLCQRRARKKGSKSEPQLYVSKGLMSNPYVGMKNVKRELEILRFCEHPNILRYVDFSYGGTGLDSRPTRLFTEYCALGDLDQFNIQKGNGKRLSFEEGLQIFRQLAQALLYIHHGIFSSEGEPRLAAAARIARRGSTKLHEEDWQTILHRDIKPANGQLQTLLGSYNIMLGTD
jgi:serine/threonine protein kinase